MLATFFVMSFTLIYAIFNKTTNKFQGFKETAEWDEFFGDLELVEGAPYTVTNADKSGNTKAYQGLKSNKLNKITGKPLYTAADHLKLSHEPEGEVVKEEEKENA